MSLRDLNRIRVGIWYRTTLGKKAWVCMILVPVLLVQRASWSTSCVRGLAAYLSNHLTLDFGFWDFEPKTRAESNEWMKNRQSRIEAVVIMMVGTCTVRTYLPTYTTENRKTGFFRTIKNHTTWCCCCLYHQSLLIENRGSRVSSCSLMLVQLRHSRKNNGVTGISQHICGFYAWVIWRKGRILL